MKRLRSDPRRCAERLLRRSHSAASLVHTRAKVEHLYSEVGLPELDGEHRTVGRTLREMLQAITRADRDQTLLLGEELVGNLAAHYTHEEALMRDIAYESTARHAEVHRHFLAEASQRIDELGLRGISADFSPWAQSLPQWFRRHAVTEDVWLARALGRSRSASNGRGPRPLPASCLPATDAESRFLVLVDWPTADGAYSFGDVVGYGLVGFADLAEAERFCDRGATGIGRLRIVDLHTWNGKVIKVVCEKPSLTA